MLQALKSSFKDFEDAVLELAQSAFCRRPKLGAPNTYHRRVSLRPQECCCCDMKHADSILITSFLILCCSFAAAPLPDGAVAYFVAPDGSDDNPGTRAKPFATLQKVNTLVEPGDSVIIRGGTYRVSEDAIARIDGVFAYPVLFERSGSRARPIRYQAYKAEIPVFDFSDVTPKGRRVYAFAVTGSWLEFKGITVTGVQVTMETHTQSVSIYNAGSCNLFEQLTMRNSQAIGFYAVQGAYNLILNCDAYENWDRTSEDGRGGNTDGFGYHPRESSQVGNVFYGCRAWHNSDDGWDVIRAYAAVTVENCWAAYNGINEGRATGDGNGFKMGGYASMPASQVPVPAPRHVLRGCLAVGNKQSGLYANHHTGGCDWTQNTAYRNKRNVNMLSRPPNNGPDCAGYDHLLVKNLSYRSKATEPHQTSLETCTLQGNSFDLQGTPRAGDFISLDEEQLMRSRKMDGSLPDITLMVPKKGSPYEGMGRASYTQKTPKEVKRSWRDSIPRESP
jgi:hypothetical protein